MFGRKRAPRPAGDAGLQDRAWSMVERGEVLVRRNHALAALPDRHAYADVLLVQVPLRAADGGGDAAPTPGDFARLDTLEDALVGELGGGEESLLALVITRGEQRRFVFYTRDSAVASAKAAAVTAGLGEGHADHGVSADPGWGVYQRFMALR